MTSTHWALAAMAVVVGIVMMAGQGTTTMVSVKSADGYYADCAAARDAGVVPIMRDEPGYRAALDPDGDGVACEPWPSTR